MSNEQVPAGWYPDPLGDASKARYWDGAVWTDQLLDITRPYDAGGIYAVPPSQVAAQPQVSQHLQQTPQLQVPQQPTQYDPVQNEVYRTPVGDAQPWGYEQPEQSPTYQQPFYGQPGQPQVYQPPGYRQPVQPGQQPWPTTPLSEPDRAGLWQGIGIASIFLLTWPLAIPQILAASAASKAHKAGDLATYRAKLKLSRVCFIVNLILMVLLLPCVVLYFSNLAM